MPVARRSGTASRLSLRCAPVSFITRELSATTWPDYEWFFSQGNGWDHCGCVTYQGFAAPREIRKWADKRDWSLQCKRELLEQGQTHGVLVYDDLQPVGWCQYGPDGELPIRRAGPAPIDDVGTTRWRITCFCVAPAFRQQGVTRVALAAALRSIAEAGGGIVRSAPTVSLPNDPGLDELIRERGGAEDRSVRSHAKKVYGATSVVAYDRKAWSVGGIFVDGFGPLWASVRRAGLTGSHSGSVSLFKRHRFKPKAVIEPTSKKLPISRLVMERTVRATR